jgi:hypothetical protein
MDPLILTFEFRPTYNQKLRYITQFFSWELRHWHSKRFLGDDSDDEKTSRSGGGDG